VTDIGIILLGGGGFAETMAGGLLNVGLGEKKFIRREPDCAR
jgi:hypothetical protein